MMLFDLLLAFAIALIIQNIAEWIVHKYILHGLGLKKDSFFHYHWEHHNRCRKSNNLDEEYIGFFVDFRLSPMLKKELAMMVGLTLFVAAPIYFFAWKALGIATAVVVWYYFFSHAWSHCRYSDNRSFMPWHHDHHMGKDQNQNWCVSFPWFDWLVGTRVKK